MSPLPTIVLVHGAWHTPYHYRPYITALQKHGFVVHCPRLPSSNDVSSPAASLAVDVNCHSYGGLVGTNAIKGISRAERQKSRQPGGVIIFSILEAFGYASLWPQFMDDSPDGTTIPREPELWFYGGIDKQIIKSDLVPQLVCAPLSILRAEAEPISWKEFLPATYVFTQQDYAVPRDFQNQMNYDTSDSIFLTRTAEMIQVAERAAMDGRNLS
ncbi:alpha/beta hydrolase [Aspergillus foveolatus]|uniref:alpha/beta hydrolase n=1 Tax=Aspergillus foveolatus TaxID=210207 RepID=UPI003CCCC8E5